MGTIQQYWLTQKGDNDDGDGDSGDDNDDNASSSDNTAECGSPNLELVRYTKSHLLQQDRNEEHYRGSN